MDISDITACLEIVTMATPHPDGPAFQVRFASLFKEGRAMAFPCDAMGRVQLDALPLRARDNYLFARSMIGREYSQPRVLVAEPAGGEG